MTIEEVAQSLTVKLENMPNKSEKRAYLLTLRKEGYDFEPVISMMLFGPKLIKDKTLGFYVLKTVANTDLLKLRLAWCLLNGYGCRPSRKNNDSAINILLKLESKIRKNPPEYLFKTDTYELSWTDSKLIEELENWKNACREIEQKRISQKRHMIQVRCWRKTHRAKVIFIEKALPVLYYLTITTLLNWIAYSHSKYNSVLLIASTIIFEICLIGAFVMAVKPTDEEILSKFPATVIYIPFINCLYLYFDYSGNSIYWISAALFAASGIVLKIGYSRYKRNILLKDVPFFKRVIYPLLPPEYKWEVKNYLYYEFGDLTKFFPHLPKRFKHYELVRDLEDGIFSNPGTFLNGERLC